MKKNFGEHLLECTKCPCKLLKNKGQKPGTLEKT